MLSYESFIAFSKIDMPSFEFSILCLEGIIVGLELLAGSTKLSEVLVLPFKNNAVEVEEKVTYVLNPA